MNTVMFCLEKSGVVITYCPESGRREPETAGWASLKTRLADLRGEWV